MMGVKLSVWLKLVVPIAVLLALLMGLLLTPLGDWLWQGFLHLPGIAWARDQIESTSESDAPGDAAADADTDAIHAILQSGYEKQMSNAYEEALQSYREALRLDDRYAPSHVALAGLYMQLGRQDQAIEELETAAGLQPDSPMVFTQLGQLYLQQGDLPKAVAALQRAKEIDPEDPITRYWLGVAYHQRSYQDAEDSVHELEEAVRLEPNEADLYFHLAMAYVRRDDDQDTLNARAALKRTLELDPSQTEPYYYLGQLALQDEDYATALEAWRRYVAVSDDLETVEKVRQWLPNLQERVEQSP